MRPGAGDKLYLTLERTYRRRATRTQFLLSLLVLALSLGAMALHYSQVFRPWQEADFALASLGYQPWYLVQEEALPLPQEERSEESGETPGRQEAVVKATLRAQSTHFVRPNLVPETGVSYSPSQVEERVAAYLETRGAGTSKWELAARARELVGAYAAARASGLRAFPFPAELERSVLEREWLWDLRQGCEPQIYLKFPPGQLDGMGCGLASIPVGKPFGVGVAFIEERGMAPRPAIAVVWEGK